MYPNIVFRQEKKNDFIYPYTLVSTTSHKSTDKYNMHLTTHHAFMTKLASETCPPWPCLGHPHSGQGYDIPSWLNGGWSFNGPVIQHE